MRGGTKPDLVRYVKFLVGAGVLKRPVWLDVLESVPPFSARIGRRPPRITFPEDTYVDAHFRRNPASALEPIDLAKFEPNSSLLTAITRLHPDGVNESTKTSTSGQESSSKEQMSESGGPGSVLELVHAEEDAHLKEALDVYTEQHEDQFSSKQDSKDDSSER